MVDQGRKGNGAEGEDHGSILTEAWGRLGYDAAPRVVPAHDVGAPQLRAARPVGRDALVVLISSNAPKAQPTDADVERRAMEMSMRGLDACSLLGIDPPEEHDEVAVSGSPDANVWMGDPRVVDAELMTFMADRAMRRGKADVARAAYREAAREFAQVASAVPATHPNTRSDLAVAAVTCLVRAKDFNDACGLARQFMSEPVALADHGRSSLLGLIAESEDGESSQRDDESER